MPCDECHKTFGSEFALQQHKNTKHRRKLNTGVASSTSATPVNVERPIVKLEEPAVKLEELTVKKEETPAPAPLQVNNGFDIKQLAQLIKAKNEAAQADSAKQIELAKIKAEEKKERLR